MIPKLLTGSIVVALVLSATCGYGGTWVSLAPSLVAMGVGQSPDARLPDKKAQAQDLLRRARQAMAENDLAAADALIGQAEGLGVEYSAFHFGDTPRKARNDLAERRAAGGRQPGAAAAPADPFAARAQAAGVAQGPVRLPAVQQAYGIQGLKPDVATSANPLARPAMAAPPAVGMASIPSLGRAPTAPGAEAQSPSNQLLLGARKSLAMGDVRRASALVEQAKAVPGARGPYDDTPESVEAAIRRHNELQALPPDRKNSESYRREYARSMMEQAEGLARRGEFDEAERLSHEALRQQVVFGPLEATPQGMLQRIAGMRRSGGAAPQAPAALPGGAPAGASAMPAGVAFAEQGGAPAAQVAGGAVPGQAVVQAGAQMVIPAGGGPLPDQRASQAIYTPANDSTRNVAASFAPQAPANLQSPGPQPAGSPQAMNVGMALLEQGEAALRARDHATAQKCFREAAQYRDQLDPISQQRLQDHLQLLSMTTPRAPSGIVDEAGAKQQLLAKQVLADVVQEESAARALRDSDPKRALAMLEQTRQKVEGAGLDPAARDQLLRRVDRSVAEMRAFIDQNRPRIELDEKNRRIKDDISRQEKVKVEVQEKVAMMVNDYNRLMEEQRYEEAQVLAKRAAELDPKNPVVHQILAESKLIARVNTGRLVQSQKEQGFVDAMVSVDKASIPFDDLNPYVHGDVKEWQRLSDVRKKAAAERGRRRSEREIEIEQKLKTPVSLQFENASLSSVLEYLGKYAQVNVHMDPQGLAEEGVTSDTPVTIKLQHEISLKSALNLILQPLHLNYVIKDEVLKVTSEQLRSGEVYTVTYNVADLVIPIPNFMPSADAGLAGSYRNGVDVAQRTGALGAMGLANAPVAVVASRDGGRGAAASINPAVLAQMPNGGSGGAGAMQPPTGSGPGGLGGATQADFESLIDLITSTIKPTSWDTVGGPGSIAQFETNLSLVVSQTQDVHDDIVDLLEQLRKLQDLQVTIEVRFITLNDQFFERIGIDFDFDLNSNVDSPFQIFGNKSATTSTSYTTNTTTNQGVPRDFTDRDLKGSQSATVGLQAPGVFSADLDIPFRQGTYELTTPTFGRYDATAGASLGFAILSDIEAYFFMQAAQGDRRTNVLQAPKVTLFNGQQAFVSDTSQSPFVISVIPVVGDFAAALQPVIVVLSEGTFLTVQAVVSNDRRFVRLTVVPFFSKIGDVNKFTFEGKTTTTTNSETEGNQETPNDNTKKADEETVTSEGTTVQLPTFAFVTVTTTVSVPDGGTVLLGGIKRLSEERNEQGVPILNKIPYVNRLFQNVGIGRDTQSLMMMVTPRIIIQEEEESKLGVQP
jgi:general secretion pathway protein D